MSFKVLHEFTVTTEREVSQVFSTEQNGEKITKEKKVIKKVPTTIVLKEPSRREKQDLSLFQGVVYNEGIGLGLLPQLVMTQKISRDPNNPLSADEDKNLTAMNGKLQELANDYIRLNAQSGEETDDQKERKNRLLTEYMVLHKKVVDINTTYQSVFAHTAERYAQNKVLTWLTLFLSYVKVGDKYEPMFGGAAFKDKEERLGELEDNEDKVYLAAVDKLSTYWMLYYFGRASKPGDFAKIEEQYMKDIEAAEKIKADAEKVKVTEAVAPPVETAPAPAAPAQSDAPTTSAPSTT